MSISISITQSESAKDLPLPSYATAHSAGMDLLAAIHNPVVIRKGKRVLIPTGLSIALPDGYEAQIRPRSGLALKNGVTVLNSPGTIDADYRGEIGVILINLGEDEFTITRGMRIAQMIVAPYNTVLFQVSDTLPSTERGTGGFGSTGTGS